MNNVYLYKKDSKGKTRQWRGWLESNEDGTVTIKLEHGQQNGKLQIKERLVKKGKNLNKANSTTVYEQAESDLKSIYQKQLDDGYVTDIANYTDPRRPMLAHKYQDRGKSVDWEKEQYASTKLDGIRCFIFVDKDGNCTFESRTGKSFKHFEHLEIEIQYKKITNCILDGELYSEDIPFEKICSLVNSEDYILEEDSEIKFYIYDMISNDNLDETFKNRYTKYNDLFNMGTKNYIIPVAQTLIESEEKMKELAATFVANGYEGLMLKPGNSIYEFGKRSTNLLKYKEMHSDEFKIKDIFIAENDENRVQIELYIDPFKSQETFKIGTLKGNKEDNYNNYYINKDNLIGKWLTINYQTLTSYGVPLFPVGITIREGREEDNQFIPEI